MSVTTTGKLALYRVEAIKRVTFLVAARTEEEARATADLSAPDAFYDYSPELEVEYVEDVVKLWGGEEDEIPYGDNDDELTAQEIADGKGDTGDPEPSEQSGPVHWCEVCHHERVQFDFREPVQICRTCKVPPLEIDR